MISWRHLQENKDGLKSNSAIANDGLVSRDKLKQKQLEKPSASKDNPSEPKYKKYQRPVPVPGNQKSKDPLKKEVIAFLLNN